MNAVPSIPARVLAIAAASALCGCAIPDAETLSPFHEPWPWTKVVAVNHTDHDVLVVHVGRCETGPALRHARSTPSFCFPGTKPAGPIAVTWREARDGADAGPALGQGQVRTATARLPRLWHEAPAPEHATGAFLCVVLRNDAGVDMAVAASAEDCAVL